MSDINIVQIYSGITCGSVLNGELYAQRLQKVRLFCGVFTPFIRNQSPL